MYLFLDTETTGFPNADIEARNPKQGRVCQLALILADENGRSLAEYTSLIAPDGWSISEGAAKVHGLDDDICAKYGMESRKAFLTFLQFARKAKVYVAHNLDFDMRVLDIEAYAHGLLIPEGREMFCTMKATTDICKLPKARGSGYKWPKLGEALETLCGRKQNEDTAHDAMADTRDCMEVFFKLKELEMLGGLA